jgi:hypothetical protein
MRTRTRACLLSLGTQPSLFGPYCNSPARLAETATTGQGRAQTDRSVLARIPYRPVTTRRSPTAFARTIPSCCLTSRGSRLRARLSASIRTPSTFGSATNGRSTRPTKDHYENLYKALLPPPAVRCAAASQAAAPRCDVRPVRVKSVMLFCRHELPLAQTRRVQPDRANLEAMDDLLLSLSYVSIRENLHCKIHFIKNSTTGLLQLRNL